MSQLPTSTPFSTRTLVRRGELRKLLRIAATVRMCVSMASIFPSMLIVGLIVPLITDNDDVIGFFAIFAVFGMPMLVSFLLTQLFCKRWIRCPNCQHSLWRCGTDNFKPGRMEVRSDASECPRCGLEIR